MTKPDFTGKTKAELVELLDGTVRRLREKLADTIAVHDVWERKYGAGTQVREEGEANAYRSALYLLGAGDFDEIDAQAESMWPAAMARRVETLTDSAAHSSDPEMAEKLARTREVARQLLAEHEAAKRAAA